MRIISKKKYKEMQDLITGLQQDYNDLKDKQVDLQLELKYMQEQKEIAERQVKYLQDELRTANDIKKVLPPKPPKGTKEIKIKVDGSKQIVGYAWEGTKEQPKRGEKPTKCKCESALFVEQKDGQYKLATEETIKNAKRGRKPRKEKEDGTKGKNVQKK